MKAVLGFLLLTVLAGCAHGPTTILVKNCKSLGSDLYSCEPIPPKAVKP